MRTLYLSDNGWVIKRTNIKDDEGIAPVGLTARCFLAVAEDSIVPIHATLEVAAVPIVAGELRALLDGQYISLHIEPLLDLAEEADDVLEIYERVISVEGDYSDFEVLQVERNRRAGQ